MTTIFEDAPKVDGIRGDTARAALAQKGDE